MEKVNVLYISFIYSVFSIFILVSPIAAPCNAFPATFDAQSSSVMPERPSKDARAFFATCKENCLSHLSKQDYANGLKGEAVVNIVNFAARLFLCNYEDLQTWKQSWNSECALAIRAQSEIANYTQRFRAQLSQWRIFTYPSHTRLAQYLTRCGVAFFVQEHYETESYYEDPPILAPRPATRYVGVVHHCNQVVGFVDTATHPNHAILKVPRGFIAVPKIPDLVPYANRSLEQQITNVMVKFADLCCELGCNLPYRNINILDCEHCGIAKRTQFLYAIDPDTYQYVCSVIVVSAPHQRNSQIQEILCYPPSYYSSSRALCAHYTETEENGTLAIQAPRYNGRRVKLLMLYSSVTDDDGKTGTGCIEYPPKFDAEGSTVSYTMPDQRGTATGKFLPSTYFTANASLFAPFTPATTDLPDTISK